MGLSSSSSSTYYLAKLSAFSLPPVGPVVIVIVIVVPNAPLPSFNDVAVFYLDDD
jgi:hypothetical protein